MGTSRSGEPQLGLGCALHPPVTPVTPRSPQSPRGHPTVTPWSPHGPHVPSQLDFTPLGEGQCESLSPDKYLLKLISFQGWIELQGALGHRFWWL